MRKKKTVSLDFDGVLHGYSKGWHDGTIYDPPTPGATQMLVQLARSYRLVISTCREDKEAIWRWLRVWGMADLIEDVTNEKPVASAYVDDRAVPFVGDWLAVADGIERLMAGVSAISGPGAGKGGGG